jgi:hypothetical protein
MLEVPLSLIGRLGANGRDAPRSPDRPALTGTMMFGLRR